VKQEDSPYLPDTLRQLNDHTLLHKLPVVASTELPEGLRVMGASDEGRHGLERLAQDAIVRVVLGSVLTQVLFEE